MKNVTWFSAWRVSPDTELLFERLQLLLPLAQRVLRLVRAQVDLAIQTMEAANLLNAVLTRCNRFQDPSSTD